MHAYKKNMCLPSEISVYPPSPHFQLDHVIEVIQGTIESIELPDKVGPPGCVKTLEDEEGKQKCFQLQNHAPVCSPSLAHNIPMWEIH